MRAGAADWKHLPPPSEREDLGFEAVFTEAEAEQLMEGLVPKEMEDKWFIYFADDWLRFHRSWTGAYIYGLRLESIPEGQRVAEAWVNRDPEQYRGSDTTYDRQLVRFLIDALLLERAAEFPMPSAAAASTAGVYQHSVVGRAYPERVAASEDNPGGSTDVQQNPSTRLRTRLFRGIVAVVALTMFIAAVATSHVSFVFLGLAALLFLAMRID
jgi:hypothetical protein